MARHGDGCRQVLDDTIYKLKSAIKMDGWAAMKTDAGRCLVIMNTK